MTRYTKDPDATLDYMVDWSVWLAAVEDTITSSSWEVPAGLTEDSDTFTDTTATVWLSGGTAGAAYRVTNHIITAGGRADDRTITIDVGER